LSAASKVRTPYLYVLTMTRLPGGARRLVVQAVGAVLGAVVLGACGTASTVATTTSSTTTSTAPPTTTTSTTVDVGTLPQTRALPPAATPGLSRRMRALLDAVATGAAGRGLPAFFPVSAYVQTKAYADAANDWRTRLVADFAADVRALHAELDPSGAPMRLRGYAVDDAAATWVLPGEEYNKGPYWRVYDTTVAFGIGRRQGTFVVNTMISWRGEWYVVHVASFNG
jgi:hypothetical protein